MTGATFGASSIAGSRHRHLVSSGGLFGTIAAGATVENLDRDQCHHHGAGNFASVGALAGINYGIVSSVAASGIVGGGTKNGVVAGGLIGTNFGSITALPRPPP